METLTQERLKELLHYDPETGVFRWRFSNGKWVKPWDVAGWIHKTGYAIIRVGGKQHKAHRLAWLYVYGVFPEKPLDHINRNKIDNRIGNLREATRSENAQNMDKHKDNTSGFMGVSFNKRSQKWVSQIQIQGIKKHLGYFQTPEEAHVAYVNAKATYHMFNPTL
jgi:hypothetical protein